MKIDRLLSIVFILLERKQVSAQELADAFEVSKRTIYRDIDTLTIAGVPIYTIPGNNGGIRILEDYKVHKNYFSANDLSTLLVGLSSVSSTLSMAEETSALAKIKNLISTEMYEEVEKRISQISIDLTTWSSNNQLSKNFKEIRKAITNSQVVEFSYYNRAGEATVRAVEPYRLILKQTSWYLQGYCLLREEIRNFRLSRMADLHILNKIFESRNLEFTPLNKNNWVSDKVFNIKLKLDITVRERIVERCGEEAIESIHGREMLVNYPFTDDDYGYSLLLSFGEKCECLEPKHVRDKFIEKIKLLLRVYQ